jgi:hypothetical protein
LGEPRRVVIPSTFREIGESAFAELSSLEELRFEEGVERIKSLAFYKSGWLRHIVFPASLVVIDESAFESCWSLREVAFAAGSKLQYIGREAFRKCPLERVCLPASVTEIDPSAFSPGVWKNVTFEGPPPLVVNEDFLCSPDSMRILKYFSSNHTVEVPAHVEVIGKNAFGYCDLLTVVFAGGSRLKEIGEAAFSYRSRLTKITVPSSVEILGHGCFEDCYALATVTFEAPSRLEKIGERAFASSGIRSFTIPASVNEIDGSAFLSSELMEINVDPGNQRFIIRRNSLLTSDGTEIVRSFGIQREIFVPREVEVLQKSCFESLYYLTEVEFESGSKLKKICRSALSGCLLLISIAVPASVTEIEEFAFKKCNGLEYCWLHVDAMLARIGRSALSFCGSLRSIVVPASVTEIEESAFQACIGLEECSIHKDAMLVRIGEEAFAGCCCLRSFYVPRNVEGIGENCFTKCLSLSRLKFGSGEALKRIVRDLTLNEVLDNLGFTDISNLFRIEVDEDGSDLEFPGWVPVADGNSHLVLAPDF